MASFFVIEIQCGLELLFFAVIRNYINIGKYSRHLQVNAAWNYLCKLHGQVFACTDRRISSAIWACAAAVEAWRSE